MRDRITKELLADIKAALVRNPEGLRLLELLKKRLNKMDDLFAAWDQRCVERFDLALRLGNRQRAYAEAALVFETELRHDLLNRSAPIEMKDEGAERMTTALEMEREIV